MSGVNGKLKYGRIKTHKLLLRLIIFFFFFDFSYVVLVFFISVENSAIVLGICGIENMLGAFCRPQNLSVIS